jgi:hypothetical protein
MLKVRAQSAMEYLMTYGWAILIIAVVLGVLFQLGVFSGSALAPKAPPGACQIVRLGGQMSLEGECQGQLPQYVAQFNGNSIITIQDQGTGNGPLRPNNLTVSVWEFSNIPTSPTQSLLSHGHAGYGALSYEIGTAGFCFQISSATSCISLATSDSHWYNLVGTVSYNPSTGNSIIKTYINGTEIAQNSESGSLNYVYSASVILGQGASGCCNYFSGSMANVQLYNVSLSSNEVMALYREGIGGAPANIQNIMGWWPLNGNAQDYSGNNHNGQVTNVIFNGSWNSQYTP